MGDIKNPAIKQALKDFDDHEGGFDQVASKAKADNDLAQMLSEQGTLLIKDPRFKLQGATNDQIIAVIRDVAVMLAHLAAGVLALRKAVELLAKDMPSAHHPTATDSLFNSRH
jgi:hypothetical protein